MSNIGKKIINVPENTEVKIDKNSISVKGTRGQLEMQFDSAIMFNLDNNEISVTRDGDSKRDKELHGLYRALLPNQIASPIDPLYLLQI
jgi:large subunit ribosomal protein L6